MRSLFETANACGCTRVEWATDHDNPSAQAFYASLGLREDRSKILYRVEGIDLVKPP
jgi:predicted GNAT superfamily acetyltransferase